jgi:hypothetical protein
MAQLIVSAESLLDRHFAEYGIVTCFLLCHQSPCGSHFF